MAIKSNEQFRPSLIRCLLANFRDCLKSLHPSLFQQQNKYRYLRHLICKDLIYQVNNYSLSLNYAGVKPPSIEVRILAIHKINPDQKYPLKLTNFLKDSSSQFIFSFNFQVRKPAASCLSSGSVPWIGKCNL